MPSSSPSPPITNPNRDDGSPVNNFHTHFPHPQLPFSTSTTNSPIMNVDSYFEEELHHGSCVPISLDFCRRQLAYNFTSFPNLLGHRGVREVDRFSEAAK